jgi:hypothetical protein
MDHWHFSGNPSLGISRGDSSMISRARGHAHTRERVPIRDSLVVLETAFDEAWLTLKSIGNTTVKPNELARCVLRLAMEAERDPVRLHDDALKCVIPTTAWRKAG